MPVPGDSSTSSPERLAPACHCCHRTPLCRCAGVPALPGGAGPITVAMTELTLPRSRTAQPWRFLHGCLWGFVCTQACWQPPAQPGGTRGRGGQPCGFVLSSRSLPLPSPFLPCSSFVTSPLCAAAPALVTKPLCCRGSPSPPPASGGARAGCGHRAAWGLSWNLGLSRSWEPPPRSHSCLPRR